MCPIYACWDRDFQDWKILAPRLRMRHGTGRSTVNWCEQFGFHEERVINYPESIFGFPWDAWSLLAIQVAPVSSLVPSDKTIYRPEGLHAQGGVISVRSMLESLPSELITLILDDASLGQHDVLALGCASSILWDHVLQHIERDCKQRKAILAGVEIACFGSFATSIPEPLEKFLSGARNITKSAVEEYTPIPESGQMKWSKAWKTFLKGSQSKNIDGMTKKLDRELLETIKSALCHVAHPKDSWMLRNLTSKEYVRCKPRMDEGYVRGYVDDGLSKFPVDDILAMRFSWSDETRAPEMWRRLADNGVHVPAVLNYPLFGSWAGHCFDIVPLEQDDLSTVMKEGRMSQRTW